MEAKLSRRTHPSTILAATAVFLVLCNVITVAQTETVLYSFTGGADGAWPMAGLLLDAQSNLYGTANGTSQECLPGCGVVFKVSQTGTETVLHTFTGEPDGDSPRGGLIRDARGNLYGTTYFGGSNNCFFGCGVIFKVSPSGTERVLYQFQGGGDGSEASSTLIWGAQGDLYGTTHGTVFKLGPGHKETVLSSLDEPNGRLVKDADGNLYGTTFFGPNYGCYFGFGCGVVFELSPTGAETVLYNFTGGADGGNPAAGLIRDAAGNLYGTTALGGTVGSCAHNAGCGVIFKLTPSGTETVLYTFSGGADGAAPGELIMDAKGNLYGTTGSGGAFGQGTVFELTTAGVQKVLYSFTGGTDGGTPLGRLVRDSHGNFYGTTQFGGAWSFGTVFKLTP
jgi:uncharacterized repeat protein (TIGR03803 family)